ncbi:MAG TPA: hypothetical protein DDZ80_25835 [Cyanobacteria bacterium UBA8803]|nr:hypothetical protein [Cyanobacteria bacterium UBA9273]HBL61715.1 hypothetical protein [Cyanobacteria bacterium UBA8803]
MTKSPIFYKYFLTPTLIFTAIWGALTSPLAIVGPKPIVIQLQEEPIFDGQLRDIATPYFMASTLLSLGAAFSYVALIGWRQSSRKSALIEKDLSSLQQELKAKETKITQLKLQASGLTDFLQPEHSTNPEAGTKAGNFPSIAYPSEHLFLILNNSPLEPADDTTNSLTVESAVQPWAVAQSFLGFKTVKSVAEKSSLSTANLTQIAEIQEQIYQLQTQFEMLQDQLLLSAKSIAPAVAQSENAKANSKRLYQQLPASFPTQRLAS